MPEMTPEEDSVRYKSELELVRKMLKKTVDPVLCLELKALENRLYLAGIFLPTMPSFLTPKDCELLLRAGMSFNN